MANKTTATKQMLVNTLRSNLQSVFNDIEELYYCDKEFTQEMLTGGAEVKNLIELPLLSDGVTFNLGEVELTQVKLTTETIWTSKAKRGDADISFNIPSVSDTINNLFLTQRGDEASIKINEKSASGSTIVDTIYGFGYGLQPKAVKGSLIIPAQNRQVVIVLTNIEAYASLSLADGDNPAYFTLKVTLSENADGVEMYIFNKTTDTGASE